MKIGTGLTVKRQNQLNRSRKCMGSLSPLNTFMMKAKVSPNLISFVTIRRGNWIMKISVYKTKEVLLVAQHYYETEKFQIKHFFDQNNAAEYIDKLAEEV